MPRLGSTGFSVVVICDAPVIVINEAVKIPNPMMDMMRSPAYFIISFEKGLWACCYCDGKIISCRGGPPWPPWVGTEPPPTACKENSRSKSVGFSRITG